MILGPLVETQFRRVLELGDGDFLVFLQRPFSAVVLGLAAVMIVLPLVSRRFGRARDAVDDGDVDAAGLAPSETSGTR